VARELALSEGEPAWKRLLDQLPGLRSQFKQSSACQPFRHMPAISFRSSAIAGKRWAMLPSAAGFIDPLLSTGFALTLTGIERLAQIIHKHRVSADLARQLQGYAQETESDLLAAGRLIGALYATMADFSSFTAVSLLYFAAVSFAETAHRLGKPELAPGFLLHRHPSFGPDSQLLLERAYRPDAAFAADIQRLIEPFNVGGFGDPARHNRYPVRADDLLNAGHKLGATREEIIAMLDKSGFFQPTSVKG
jgi:FADH2 O2-dependent halogenase